MHFLRKESYLCCIPCAGPSSLAPVQVLQTAFKKKFKRVIIKKNPVVYWLLPSLKEYLFFCCSSIKNALVLFRAASRWQSHSLAEDVQPEIWIAQELRRIGDEFNASYCPRRVTFIFSLSISLCTVSKREKLNHLWKLVLWWMFHSLKCRKGCAGGCVRLDAGVCCLRRQVICCCSIIKSIKNNL